MDGSSSAVGSAAARRDALRRLIQERLRDTRPPVDAGQALPSGIFTGPSERASELVRGYYPSSPAAAAVLVPIVDHADGLSILLTQRAAHLRHHPGQISFPGGRIEPYDGGPREAALRETEEEIGLTRERVAVAGYLESQLVLSGFWITPVVGFVQPGFTLSVDHREVESTFEVPLEHILDSSNHHWRERVIGETSVRVYEIPYDGHHIWGATAGMLLGLYRLLR